MRAFLLAVALWGGLGVAWADESGKKWFDLDYAESGKAATRLDVYAPAAGSNHPVMIWIHGGAWRLGDKAQVQAKPAAFNARGWVLVSVNYPLSAESTYRDQAGAIAQAIAWVHAHIGQYGGAADQIYLLGHSAGAHLAALVATDPRYLEAEKLRLSNLRGVVLLDGAGYDVPRQIELARLPRMKEMYLGVFGDDPAKQQDASPIAHVKSGQGIPPFLILYVAGRIDSKLQSNQLARKLNAAGSPTRVVAAEGKTHATINRELGDAGEAPTAEVFEFLKNTQAARR